MRSCLEETVSRLEIKGGAKICAGGRLRYGRQTGRPA
jgi:hypothetical protein